MYLHSGPHCSLYIIPLWFRGVKNFDGMGTPRDLSMVKSIRGERSVIRDKIKELITVDHAAIKLK